MNLKVCFLIMTFGSLSCFAMEQEEGEGKKNPQTEEGIKQFMLKAKKRKALDYANIDEQFGEPINRKLHKAIVDDNIEEIKQAIREGADPNTCYIRCPLYYAIQQYLLSSKYGDIEGKKEYLNLVKFLTEHEANPNLSIGFEKTPYQLASAIKDKTIKDFFDSWIYGIKYKQEKEQTKD